MPDLYIIKDEDLLYRRFPIIEEPNYAVFWKLDNGRKIPSSAAFKTKPGEDGLSVNIAELTSPEATVGDPAMYGAAEIPAAIPIAAGYDCVHRPEDDNYAHALILGDTNPVAKKLSRALTNVYLF